MKLYIQIQNGQPIKNPAFEDNLLNAYGSIPSNWAPFNRIEQPSDLLKNPFQTAKSNYALSSDGITWEDQWVAVDMTDAEKQALITEAQAHPPGPNMTMDTSTLLWNPNTPMPTDGKKYYWEYFTGEWAVIPSNPTK
jgi:hypothetical protein